MTVTHKWDALIKNSNKHKYTVTDCTDRKYVGINITHDEDCNYYTDQSRVIMEIVKVANLKGGKGNCYLPWVSCHYQRRIT